MKKLYTQEQYIQKANEANALGQKLYVHTFEQEYMRTVKDYEYKEELQEVQVYDEEGNPLYDEEGNPVMEEQLITVAVPIMIDVEVEVQKEIYDEDGNLVLDENGNPVYETLIEIVQVQQTHQEPAVEEVAELLIAENGYYICYKDNYTDGTINENLEEEKAKTEAERIAKLSLTKREVFLALYQDKGISPEQIRSQITDTTALIEFDYAEKYYRGNPLIDMLGQALGYTKEQLDYLFIQGEFNCGT